METRNPPGARHERDTGWLSAGLRTWRRLLSYPGAAAVALETRVGTTPCEVVHEAGTHRLLRYRRDTPATWAEPLLCCYALINRPYILDLQPDKSVVRQYLDRGFDVYIIDWGVPAHSDCGLTLEHYVCGFLKEAVELIVRERGRNDLHLLGYCMGGTMSAIFAALYPSLVKTLTLLAAPIDFGGRESLLNVWTEREHFDVDAFVDAHGNCPAWFLQSCFQHMKPIENILQKNASLLTHIEDPTFVANYFALELWIQDNIPVAGETFREFVKDLYQGNKLIKGELHLGQRRVDLTQITCPLLLLMAESDHLVAPASTDGIRLHVASHDVETHLVDAGHVGLVIGGKARRTLWPRATQWLDSRSTSLRSTHNERCATP